MQRQSWSNNGHIEVDWSRVRPGDVVDYVEVEVKACPVRYGPPQWNVLVVAPNSEAATVERLRDASMRTYWPKVFKWVATREFLANGQKKMEKVPRPMFPGYAFVDLRRGLDDFRAPLGVKGVRDYLWSDGQPCVLPPGLYEALLEREGEKSRETDEKKLRPFKIGESVRVKEGPFRDFVAIVERMDDRGRAMVLLEVFARPTAMQMDVVQLEKA